MIRPDFVFRLFIGLLGTFLFRLPSVAQVHEYIPLTPDERIVKLWGEINGWRENDVAAQARLDSIKTLAKEQGDDRLFWYVVLHQIWYRSNIQSRRGKPATAYEEAKSYMETCPFEVVRASYYFLYGQYTFRERLDFAKAFRLLFRARSIFETIGYENIPEAVYYLSRFGDDYYWFEDYKTSIQYMELAARFANNKLVPQYRCQNTRGMAYQRLKDYKKAEQAFKNVVALAKAQPDTAWVGIGSNGYGNTLRLMGRNQEALPYLYQDVALNAVKVPESAALSCLFVAQSLLSLDSTAKAKTYIDRARTLYNDYRFSLYWVNYYETLTAYLRKTGNPAKAASYLDSTITLKDSLKVVFSNKALLLAENTTNAERYLSNLDQVEREKSNAILIRNIIIAALFLLGMSGLYAFNLKRQKLEQEKQLEEEQRKRADEQLAHAKAQLDQYLTNLKEKNELITQISEELVSARQDSPEQVAIQTQQVNTLRNSVILTDKGWQQFRQLFEQVHPHFFDLLRQTYSDLTPAETRLLALLKLDVSSKEMAFMLGVSAESVRKSRYRLRKKLEQKAAETALRTVIEQL